MNNLTVSERTWESTQTMTAAREESWRSCNDWTSAAGQGVLEKSKDTFDTIVNKRCPFCCDWEPVMTDRAGSNPAVASDDLDNSDGDPEETEVDGDDDEDDGNKKPAAKASSIQFVLKVQRAPFPSSIPRRRRCFHWPLAVRPVASKSSMPK